VHVRKTVSCVLRDAHAARAPRVLLGLRAQDPVPNWITHVLDVDPPASVGAAVWAGPREAWQSLTALAARAAPPPVVAPRPKNGAVARAPLVEMRGVRVAYGARAVLDGIDWTIRPGERWHLAGGNGAGKTTLLALLSGEHPLSYAQRHLHLWGRRRNAWPAAELRKRVGVVSPEAADALPRVAGRSVWAVVGTGWEGAFVPAGADGVGHVEGAERDARVRRTWEVLAALGPAAWGDVPSAPPPPSVSVPAGAPDAATRAFATKEYMDLAPGERSAVLLARALVARPPLLLLDEAWAGMDARQVGAARAFLRSDVGAAQAAVVVSHWEEEVPWTGHEVRRLRLEEGRASVEV
jgi:ABC-type molybdenum transport system ATPase subunit/photorepair protein PhrA